MKIDALREIVKSHSMAALDPMTWERVSLNGEFPDERGDVPVEHSRGIWVDVQTANAVCTVHDALSEENRAKLLSMPLPRACDIAWKVLSRSCPVSRKDV